MNSRALGAVLRTVGVEVSESELTTLMTQLSVSSSTGESCIDVEEFIHLMTSPLDDAGPSEEIDRAFKAFDADSDGHVGQEDLRAAAGALGVDLDEAGCAEMLGEVARDPTKGASREEFASLIDG